MDKKSFRLVFMGTSDFAVPSLKALVNSDYRIAGVITAPDKEAGRGQKLRFSPVKEFALLHNLELLQPVNLKDPGFQSDLKSLQPDLQVVVAFRMLPQAVWALPAKGTINLHASLLPQYRGAAPINHAIINGENQTGLTTFFINENIDTGGIIRQTPVDIGEEENFGELYQRLREMSPAILMDTVDDIFRGAVKVTDQQELIESTGPLKPAPKIFRESCRIDFDRPLTEVYNFIRGLSPYPAAFATLQDAERESMAKIFRTRKEKENHSFSAGKILSDGKSYMKIAVPGGWLHILELQLAGKKRLSVTEFLNGNRLTTEARFK
jgi:methionyl-tRNA formyltransferase